MEGQPCSLGLSCSRPLEHSRGWEEERPLGYEVGGTLSEGSDYFLLGNLAKAVVGFIEFS